MNPIANLDPQESKQQKVSVVALPNHYENLGPRSPIATH